MTREPPPWAARWRSLLAAPDDAATRAEGDDAGVAGNARLTSSTAVVLFVLLAVEGATLVDRRALLTPHVVIGALLIPPVAVKMASTGYRFARYYGGAAAYRLKGPPAWGLRVLGPAVVALTVALLASGVALLYAAPGQVRAIKDVHRVGFVLWFCVMTVHVLGHLLEMVRIGPADWLGRAPRVPGATARRLALVASLGAGVALAALLVPHVGPFVASLPAHFDD